MVGAVRMRVLPDNGENGWEDQNLGANYTPIAVVSTVALSIGLVQVSRLSGSQQKNTLLQESWENIFCLTQKSP